LLSFKLEIDSTGLVIGYKTPYNFIKLNSIMYAEFLSKPIVSKNNEDIVIRMVQENNYSDSFPR